MDTLLANVRKNPGDYTVWFRIALEKMTENKIF